MHPAEPSPPHSHSHPHLHLHLHGSVWETGGAGAERARIAIRILGGRGWGWGWGCGLGLGLGLGGSQGRIGGTSLASRWHAAAPGTRSAAPASVSAVVSRWPRAASSRRAMRAPGAMIGSAEIAPAA